MQTYDNPNVKYGWWVETRASPSWHFAALFGIEPKRNHIYSTQIQTACG